MDVFTPSALLAGGSCLVDTPGLGSVSRSNAGLTEGFVPHIDASLVALGADPPISGDELALGERVAANAGSIIFVLNKADWVSEADLDEAARFTVEVLSKRLGRLFGQPLHISAVERRPRGPTRDWATLEHALSSLARNAGAGLVLGAVRRGARAWCERFGRS